jgi:hypothetical protein
VASSAGGAASPDPPASGSWCQISGDVPPAEALVRETKVRGADGTETRLRLIEFP